MCLIDKCIYVSFTRNILITKNRTVIQERCLTNLKERSEVLSNPQFFAHMKCLQLLSECVVDKRNDTIFILSLRKFLKTGPQDLSSSFSPGPIWKMVEKI